MEYIINVTQFKNMKDNKIIGTPKLIESEITFKGVNNVLICNNIKLENVILNFEGNNTILYLGSDLGKNFRLTVYNNSTIYMGKQSKIGQNININVLENKNLIIGDKCIIENNVHIETSEEYPIYDSNSKNRINNSKSIYIGDHVWLGNFSHVSKGVKIGSGSIINSYTFIPPNIKIPSNVMISGNPIKIIRDNIFFTADFLGQNTSQDIINSQEYKSNVFIYELIENQTLNLEKIEELLIELTVSKRLEFIQKLFVENKRKNRFTIK